MSRKYELVYVVSPDATDEQVAELHTQVESIVQRMHGQLEKTDNWGRRKLAYEIGRHKEGTYVLEVINGDGELMKEIDRRLKVTDLIIRHLVVRVDEEQAVVDRIGLCERSGDEARSRCRRPGNRDQPCVAIGERPLLSRCHVRREAEVGEHGRATLACAGRSPEGVRIRKGPGARGKAREPAAIETDGDSPA